MARNMLDPKIVTESEIRELPLFIKIYGGLCIASGVISIPVYLMFFGYIAQQLIQNPDTVTIGANPLVALAIAIVGISFAVLDTVGLIVLASRSSRIADATLHAGHTRLSSSPSFRSSSI